MVQGLVWLDADGDGVRSSGEAGYPGPVTVQLLGAGGAVAATTTTDSTGHYTFLNVPAGTYSVQFERPAGYTFSPSNRGTDDSADSDVDPSTGQAGPLVVAAGQLVQGPDAGLLGGVCAAASICSLAPMLRVGLDLSSTCFSTQWGRPRVVWAGPWLVWD